MFCNKAAIQKREEARSLLREPWRLRAGGRLTSTLPGCSRRGTAEPSAASSSSLPRLKLQPEKYYHSRQTLHTGMPYFLHFPHKQFPLTILPLPTHQVARAQPCAPAHFWEAKNKSKRMPAWWQHYVSQNFCTISCWKDRGYLWLTWALPLSICNGINTIMSFGEQREKEQHLQEGQWEAHCVNSRRRGKTVWILYSHIMELAVD